MIFNRSPLWRSQRFIDHKSRSNKHWYFFFFLLHTLHLVTFKYETRKIEFGRYSTEKKKVVKYIWKINPCIFMCERRTEKTFFSHYKDDLKYKELPKKKPQKTAVSDNQMQDQISEKHTIPIL